MKHIRLSFLLLFMLTLVSWGKVGHTIINRKCPSCLPAVMTGFQLWSDSLSIHASDADNRKSADPNESPRHFIDLDYYSEFLAKGRIASTYDSVVVIHGSSFVIANGTLPWATITAYDSLKLAFKNLQWHKAMLFASDLGHYVADGHMPLHLTPNYDGQLTGQKGIHSRYETTMVYNNQTALASYTADTVGMVTDVNNYIFDYIYTNHRYVDSVLLADKEASILAGNTTSAVYYQQLWNKTKFTIPLFKNASHALAELIYTAWKESDCPVFGSPDGIENTSITAVGVYPNPFIDKVTIAGDDQFLTIVSDMTGKKVAVCFENEIVTSQFPPGIYVFSVYSSKALLKQIKMIKLK